jgi:CubicO group peptidase (beta-lactamase class C family)
VLPLLLVTWGILAACGAPAATSQPATEPALIEVTVAVVSPMPDDTAVPEGVLSPKDLAAFDFVVEKKIEAVPLAGVTLAIRWGNNPPYLKGYGHADLATATPAMADTVYQIASLTKQFTAAAVMQLVEQGRIGLDDPVSRFYPQAPETWQGVTVHHLLSHTSGIPDVGERASEEGLAGVAVPNSVEELIDALRDDDLWFEPGTQFKYGSSGYQLLAGIIEETTGDSAEAYFRTHLFEPLGLESTFACYANPERVAQGYQIAGGSLQPIVAYDPVRGVGASGLCSTAGDLVRWQQALSGGRVVSPESYQKMITPTELAGAGQVPYGYGLGVGEGVVAHGGAVPGFRSWMVYHPQEDLALVILSNTDVPAGYSLDVLGDVIAERILDGSGR